MLLEKLNKDPCYLVEDIVDNGSSRLFAGRDFFLFFARGAMSILRIVNLSYRMDIFISGRSFRSELVVYYLSRGMNKHAKKQFNEDAYIILENGYRTKVGLEISLMTDVNYPRVRPTFSSSQEYVEYYTLIEQMKLEDFSFAYLFYMLWALLLLVFNLNHHLPLHAYRWPFTLSNNVRLTLPSYLERRMLQRRLIRRFFNL